MPTPRLPIWQLILQPSIDKWILSPRILQESHILKLTNRSEHVDCFRFFERDILLMNTLQASHMYARKQLDRTAGQLQDAISSVSGLESKLSSAKVKYTYMQDKRGYIADLCDMLQVCVTFKHVHSDSSASYILFSYLQGKKSFLCGHH